MSMGKKLKINRNKSKTKKNKLIKQFNNNYLLWLLKIKQVNKIINKIIIQEENLNLNKEIYFLKHPVFEKTPLIKIKTNFM